MPDWQEDARCKDLTVDESAALFFLGRGGSPAKAKAFCAECPVRLNCLQTAVVYGERGIWAGMTDEERDLIAVQVQFVWREEMRLAGQLTVFYQPSARTVSSTDSTQCLYCGAIHGGTCPNTLPPIHNWLQTDENIACIESDETSLAQSNREQSHQPHGVLALNG